MSEVDIYERYIVNEYVWSYISNYKSWRRESKHESIIWEHNYPLKAVRTIVYLVDFIVMY